MLGQTIEGHASPLLSAGSSRATTNFGRKRLGAPTLQGCTFGPHGGVGTPPTAVNSDGAKVTNVNLTTPNFGGFRDVNLTGRFERIESGGQPSRPGAPDTSAMAFRKSSLVGRSGVATGLRGRYCDRSCLRSCKSCILMAAAAVAGNGINNASVKSVLLARVNDRGDTDASGLMKPFPQSRDIALHTLSPLAYALAFGILFSFLELLHPVLDERLQVPKRRPGSKPKFAH